MIIDSHVHIGQWAYEWYLYDKGNDPAEIYQWVNKAVFIPSDKKQNEDLLWLLKKDIREDSRFFIPWFDPKDFTTTKVERFILENARDVWGLKVHSSGDKIKYGISNPVYEPLIDIALEFGLPLLVHCGRWQEFASYLYPLQMAEKYPGLKIICAHLGGDRENLKIKAPKAVKERGLDNIWFDISATREWWTIGLAIEQVGIDKIIFGSDYPVMHPKMSIESVKALGLTEAEEDRVFYKNILEVFKI